eukprot:m.33840 g.33840  ORF g.33840 m.33840 type:complete len:601 (+) comp9884_c0_seq3:80-1882(+)
METTYMKMKTANEARLADEARVEILKRNIIILIMSHLQEQGYIESALALEGESGVALSKYSVCDNVDLLNIVQEYEAYYQIKFGKPPRLIKKATVEGVSSLGSSSSRGHRQKRRSSKTPHSLPKLPQQSSTKRPKDTQKDGNKSSSRVWSAPHASSKKKTLNPIEKGLNRKTFAEKPSPHHTNVKEHGLAMNLTGHGLQTSEVAATQTTHEKKTSQNLPSVIDVKTQLQNAIINNSYDHHEDKLLRPLGNFGGGYDGQMKELANVIGQDIYLRNPNVRWKDIVGLENACRLVKEAVVYPLRYPQLFQGILSPWKGLLLYGPPGTGKTMLAKAIATECQTTFFNISASSIVSKWRGDSEKLVRVLFELARFHAPSTIFLDELDSIMSVRGGSSDHEGSRRMKTELLMQMDGLNKSNDLVFVLGASNLPWELDSAMLRRLEKRILVDLPTEEAREAMFRHHLPSQVLVEEHDGIALSSNIDYKQVAKSTSGYSGSDILLVCKEAAMKPVRQVFDVLERLEEDENHSERYLLVGMNCSFALLYSRYFLFFHLFFVFYHVKQSLCHIKLRNVTTNDVVEAISSTKPSASGHEKYRHWKEKFESA